MCLILFAYQQHPQYPFIVAANRDEFYDRPTASAHFWADAPFLLAGRDLQQQGTWMGITKSGRISAVTNFRDAQEHVKNAQSRGELVSNFLKNQRSAQDYLRAIRHKGHRYRGFNLLVGEVMREKLALYYYSNKQEKIKEVKPGIHGLSNAFLNTPWPKVSKGKKYVHDALHSTSPSHDLDRFVSRLFDILGAAEPAPNEQLPQTGMGREWERLLSPAFIQSSKYGTRSQTVLIINEDLEVHFVERSLNAEDKEWEEVTYQFQIRSV